MFVVVVVVHISFLLLRLHFIFLKKKKKSSVVVVVLLLCLHLTLYRYLKVFSSTSSSSTSYTFPKKKKKKKKINKHPFLTSQSQFQFSRKPKTDSQIETLKAWNGMYVVCCWCHGISAVWKKLVTMSGKYNNANECLYHDEFVLTGTTVDTSWMIVITSFASSSSRSLSLTLTHSSLVASKSWRRKKKHLSKSFPK